MTNAHIDIVYFVFDINVLAHNRWVKQKAEKTVTL